MSNAPQVSVIVPFRDPPLSFFREAIDSVLAQELTEWELILVDDGSTDQRTSETARDYAREDPERILYLRHPHDENRGISASRAAGFERSTGALVALLDGDDRWLPNKLCEQVALLEQHPQAALLYGRSRYWYSWAGDHAVDDFEPEHRVLADQVHDPPNLLVALLEGEAAIPCTCSVIVRREAILQSGGFERDFRLMYEDQMLYTKLLLRHAAYVADVCWDFYRQHPKSLCKVVEQRGELYQARIDYLEWVARCFQDQGVSDPALWAALERQRWLYHRPSWIPRRHHHRLRWLKKWLVRGRKTLSAP